MLSAPQRIFDSPPYLDILSADFTEMANEYPAERRYYRAARVKTDI